MRPEIPGCTIIAEIHRSPIAVIYRARQDALDRTVLVKILQTNLRNDAEIASRFQREAKACARLKHPNIVQIYDYGETDGVPYFIMEYVEGRNLQELIREEKRLDFKRVQKIVRQLLQALQYSHKKTVLHRDIKPANIIITGDDFVKITDFGLAVFQQSPEITAHDQVVGTPAYMSPEQAKGETVDERSDLFSLGVTVYEMLTGDQLFGGKSISESLHKLLQKPIELDEITKIKLPENLFTLCKGLLEKDINLRFSSAKQALAVLDCEKNLGESGIIQKKAKEKVNQSKRFFVPVVALAILAFLFIYFNRTNNPPESERNKIKKATNEAVVPANSGDSLQVKMIDPPETATVHSEINKDNKIKEKSVSVAIKTAYKDQPKTSLPALNRFAESPQPQTGYVTILCLPWANVWIDSQSYGEAALNNVIRLSAGEHFLRLNNPHLGEFIDTLQITAGDTQRVTINLDEQFGELQLDVLPWAKVFIDDKFFDDSPIWQPIRLEKGLHKIRLENPAFSIWEQEVFILPGKKKELKVTLK